MRQAPLPPPGRVVVIGAGFAGLFAAAGAAGDGREVTVVERDDRPAGAAPRPGVPQARQPHVLLHRGLVAATSLLPGLDKDIEAAGAVRVDTGLLAWLGEEGWLPRGFPSYDILSLSRPLLEDVVRRRVEALPGVRIVWGARASGIERMGEAWRVGLEGGDRHDAELVVDASGRGSRLPAWLGARGGPQPEIVEIDAQVGYATREYVIPGGVSAAPGIVLQQTAATLSGGLALPIEDGRWIVGATGVGDGRPSRDAEAFDSVLAELPDPALSFLARSGTPVTDVAIHRQTGNRRYSYERLRQWPDGLLVTGDALCAFNPVYGQGITVAACEGVLLQETLRGHLTTGWCVRLLRAYGRNLLVPWAIATGEDLRYPTTVGRQSPAQKLLSRWAREVGACSARGDLTAAETLGRVYHLMAPPTVLARPALVGRVVLSRVGRRNRRMPRPAVLDALGRR